MHFTNVEFKARCEDLHAIRAKLEAMEARFVGEDRQRDVYFAVASGRLKMRQGSIETALIYYLRPDDAAEKRSDVTLYAPHDAPALEALLTKALGVVAVVDKRREIWFVDNVKIHLDRVEGLGTFVEVEAIDDDGTRTEDELRVQAEEFRALFGIPKEALVATSYVDLVRRASTEG